MLKIINTLFVFVFYSNEETLDDYLEKMKQSIDQLSVMITTIIPSTVFLIVCCYRTSCKGKPYDFHWWSIKHLKLTVCFCSLSFHKVINVERDIVKAKTGAGDELVYTKIIGLNAELAVQKTPGLLQNEEDIENVADDVSSASGSDEGELLVPVLVVHFLFVVFILFTNNFLLLVHYQTATWSTIYTTL